jgi:hypothetical protein
VLTRRVSARRNVNNFVWTESEVGVWSKSIRRFFCSSLFHPGEAGFHSQQHKEIAMFTCAYCKKEKPESERCSVRWLINIGFRLMARTPWWPSEACKYCSRQVLLFGMTGVIIAAVVALVLVLGNLLS